MRPPPRNRACCHVYPHRLQSKPLRNSEIRSAAGLASTSFQMSSRQQRGTYASNSLAGLSLPRDALEHRIQGCRQNLYFQAAYLRVCVSVFDMTPTGGGSSNETKHNIQQKSGSKTQACTTQRVKAPPL